MFTGLSAGVWQEPGSYQSQAQPRLQQTSSGRGGVITKFNEAWVWGHVQIGISPAWETKKKKKQAASLSEWGQEEKSSSISTLLQFHVKLQIKVHALFLMLGCFLFDCLQIPLSASDNEEWQRKLFCEFFGKFSALMRFSKHRANKFKQHQDYKRKHNTKQLLHSYFRVWMYSGREKTSTGTRRRREGGRRRKRSKRVLAWHNESYLLASDSVRDRDRVQTLDTSCSAS